MTCPQGHKADTEQETRGQQGYTVYFCALCGWSNWVKRKRKKAPYKTRKDKGQARKPKSLQKMQYRDRVKEKVTKARSLLEQGICFGEVCVKLCLPASTLNRYMKEAGYPQEYTTSGADWRSRKRERKCPE